MTVSVDPIRLDIEGSDLPGRSCSGGGAGEDYGNVHVGLQRGKEVVQIRPGDAPAVSWSMWIEVRERAGGGPDFRGPEVHGRPGERFVYLSWGEVDGSGRFTMFRRAKLQLGTIPPATLAASRRPGSRLVGRLRLTDRHGTPLCASVRPPDIAWSAVDH
jgi:Family of unknown function (DUF5990)